MRYLSDSTTKRLAESELAENLPRRSIRRFQRGSTRREDKIQAGLNRPKNARWYSTSKATPGLAPIRLGLEF